MRLIGYLHSTLSENYQYDTLSPSLDIVEKTLIKQCTPFLNILRGGKKVLFRGSSVTAKNVGLIKQKSFLDTKRKPKDTPKWLHDYLNKKMGEIAGWPVRNGISVTPEAWQAQDYGTLNLFFPIGGNFEWAFLSDVYDLYAKMMRTIRGAAAEILEQEKEAARARGEIKTREEVEDLIKNAYRMNDKEKGISNYQAMSQKEREEFERLTSFHTEETKKWEERAGTPLRGWKKEWMERDEQWKAIDNFLDGKIKPNEDWTTATPHGGHRGEIMFNCKEYYLFNFRERHTTDIKTLFQRLGIPPKSYKHSMPGSPSEWA
jgi:hypothetical protein